MHNSLCVFVQALYVTQCGTPAANCVCLPPGYNNFKKKAKYNIINHVIRIYSPGTHSVVEVMQ